MTAIRTQQATQHATCSQPAHLPAAETMNADHPAIVLEGDSITFEDDAIHL